MALALTAFQNREAEFKQKGAKETKLSLHSKTAREKSCSVGAARRSPSPALPSPRKNQKTGVGQTAALASSNATWKLGCRFGQATSAKGDRGALDPLHRYTC
jgi:hypothetical protein